MSKYKKLIYFILFLSIFLLTSNLDFDNNSKLLNYLGAEPTKNKTIYLTFDDGPSKITSNILDILKQNNVPATFFLIGNQIKGYEDVVKRIYEEGHGIGLHSYTHNLKKIYSNKDLFIKEMYESRDEIAKIVDISPNILRFPGGSRKRLNKSLLKAIHECNFKIYDWNMEISDGINPNASSDRLFREATSKEVKPDVIILLMHCDYMHKNTCKALPRIISYYKNLGYDFKVITENTPEYFYPIKSN